jgi:hypothetical protein
MNDFNIFRSSNKTDFMTRRTPYINKARERIRELNSTPT